MTAGTDPEATSVDRGVPVDLHDDGLLWLINRVVFHPRGFALGREDEGFRLLGDGSEVWIFDQEQFDEDGFLRRVEAAFDRARNGG